MLLELSTETGSVIGISCGSETGYCFSATSTMVADGSSSFGNLFSRKLD